MIEEELKTLSYFLGCYWQGMSDELYEDISDAVIEFANEGQSLVKRLSDDLRTVLAFGMAADDLQDKTYNSTYWRKFKRPLSKSECEKALLILGNTLDG